MINESPEPGSSKGNLQASFEKVMAGQGTQAEQLTVGVLLLKAECFDAAGQVFRQIVRQDPDNMTATAMTGVALFHQDRMDEAEQVFREVIEAKPDAVGSYVFLGRICTARKEFRTAAQMFLQAMNIEPAYPQTYLHASEMYEESGNMQSAIFFADTFHVSATKTRDAETIELACRRKEALAAKSNADDAPQTWIVNE